MVSLMNVLIAIALSTGAHTFGHVAEGNRQQIDVTLQPTEFSEFWITPSDRKTRMLMNGAGFRSQEALSKWVEPTNLARAVMLANGVYKLGYLTKIHHKLGAPTNDDISRLNSDTASSITGYSVLASAIVDLYKVGNPELNFDLVFWQAREGTPGLVLTVAF
ncbi:hypothetical protein KAR91_18425 [Candidatus Pacearchaeota archaeon]|nr:hypothetical protein [Candidatus Pacearchaeota archaeon]